MANDEILCELRRVQKWYPRGDGKPLRVLEDIDLEKGEVTARSDIYALGLVLYEIFTGKRAFGSRTLAALLERSDTRPDSPSSHVRDLDPAVEHAILWCLEPDPSRRPRSALAVAAALPGGDPLAAALEAGLTRRRRSSPEPARPPACGRASRPFASRRSWPDWPLSLPSAFARAVSTASAWSPPTPWRRRRATYSGSSAMATCRATSPRASVRRGTSSVTSRRGRSPARTGQVRPPAARPSSTSGTAQAPAA